MEESIKYYISSDGTKKNVTTLHTAYLINAINKKKNTLFECQTSSEVMQALDQIDLLNEEYHSRVKTFLESSFNEDGTRKEDVTGE